MKRVVTTLALAVAIGCGGSEDHVVRLPDEQPRAASPKRDEPPVALNADAPVQYPPALYDQAVEGKVVLRLHVDAKGVLVPDSIKIQESSGYPALDSAAVRAAPKLRFSPALRDGRPVAASFLQPIDFRHPRHGAPTP